LDPLAMISMPGLAGIPSHNGTRIARQTAASDDARMEDENRRLEKACAEFEAIFVEQLFKTMRASIPESDLMDGGRAEEVYTEMMDQQVAREMAHGQGAIGLANQMKARLAQYSGMAKRALGIMRNI